MLPFSFPEHIETVLLVVSAVLVLLSYALMLFLPEKKAKYVIFFAVPLHLFLLNALFSVGATVDIVALVFLGLLFLYISTYAFLYYKKRGGKEDEV